MDRRRVALVAATLTIALTVAACQPYGGAGGSPYASVAESAAESNAAAPAAPSDQPEETPIASMGSDYGY